MMLIEHEGVKAELLGIAVFIQEVVVVVGRPRRIEVRSRYREHVLLRMNQRLGHRNGTGAQ